MLEIKSSERLSRMFWRLRFDAALDTWKHDVETVMLARLREEVPVRSGATRDSLSVKASQTPMSVKIEFFGGGASNLLIHGTPPHAITPHGEALKFQVGGEDLFRGLVNHPGTSPNPFHRRAFDAGKHDVMDRFREAVVASLDRP